MIRKYDQLEKEARSLASSDSESQFNGELEQDFAAFILKLDQAVESGLIDMTEKSQILDILN